MKPEQLQILIEYRMEQASDTVKEAEILYAEKAMRGTVNRAYYAMFYALLALLATERLGTSKHSGAISLFDKEFVKTGKFPKELSKSLHLAFDRRQDSDYGDMIKIDQNTAKEAIDSAKIFIAEVEKYLFSSGLLAKSE